MNTSPNWYVYMLRCRDNTLYTGITTHLYRRLNEHNQGSQAARYTRGRRPVELIYWESHATRRHAAQREAHIKQLTRRQKLRLISQTDRQAIVADDD